MVTVIFTIILQRGLMFRIPKSLLFSFSTPKEQYSRLFLIRLRFPTDGYYLSNKYRSKFISQLTSLQKTEQAMILGGDSFPFGETTLYLNCQSESSAQNIAHKNVYVEQGLATAEIVEIERVGKNKIGMLSQFYEMKMDL